MIQILLDERLYLWLGWILALLPPVTGFSLILLRPADRAYLLGRPNFWLTIAVGPFLVLLWRTHGAILDNLGFDRVLAVAANLVLFAALGLACGYLLRLGLMRRQDGENEREAKNGTESVLDKASSPE